MISALIHFFQFGVHLYFLEWVLTYDGKLSLLGLWNQFKFLTNFSNMCMLFFLVPFVLSDIKYLIKGKKSENVRDRYNSWTHLAFQGMNPVMFIVAAAYWVLFLIDPKLLFGN